MTTDLPPTAPEPMERAVDAEIFLLELGRALHTCGTPAHRLEEVLTRAARGLGLPGQFYSTPTALMMSVGEMGRQHTSLVRVEPGEVNLARLAALDDVVVAVIDEHIAPGDALERVRRIVAAPPPWGRVVTVLAYAVVSAAVSRFFGGGLADLAVAGAIGLLIGGMALGSTRVPSGVRVYELASAIAASFLAQVAVYLGLPVSPFVVTLAGLIVLVPGYTLTIAMTELATRNLVSGTARLTAAGIIFLQLAFGVALGDRIADVVLGPVPNPPPIPLPAWTEPASLVLAALGLMVVFQAPLKRAGWILLAGMIALYGSRAGAWVIGPALGASVGAFLATLFSNLYGRVLNRTAFVPLAPAILLLVPGSYGFRSISSLLERDVLAGVDTAFDMVLVAVSIVAGLLAANVVVSPRRPL